MNEPVESSDQISAAPAAMPPPTMLARPTIEMSASNTETTGVKDANLKMYHVMSIKQTLREDLAEHAYQLAVELQIGHDLTSALYHCSLSLWNSMLLMHWDNRKCQTTSSNLLRL